MEVKELQAEENQNKRSEKTLLFSQDAWNAVTDDDDWDSVSSLSSLELIFVCEREAENSSTKNDNNNNNNVYL